MLERTVERVTSKYPIEKLMDFCEAAKHDERPAAINIRPDNWENNPILYYIAYIDAFYHYRNV